MLCLVAILFPFISAIAILEGVKAQSELSVTEGADIFVTMDMFGRNGVIPIEMAAAMEQIDGVTKAVPRAVGRIYIGNKLAVLLGIEGDEKPPSVNFIKGSLPKAEEVVIGKGLAKHLGLDVGDKLNIGTRVVAFLEGEPYIIKKIFRVSGIFDSQSGIWASNLVLMDIYDAVSVFEMDDFATDISLHVRPGYDEAVSKSLQKMNPYFRIQTKGLVKTYIDRGFNMKGGVFAVLYVVAFALTIPAILVTSGFGLSERRKETGILKAAGWQTHEVLEMVFFENIMLALISAPAAFVLSFVWIKLFNAPFIAQIIIPGAESIAAFPVPSKFMPMPFVFSFFFALLLTMAGSIYSTWSAAVVSPVEAMK
ncbi:MAG: FtsX-like permease family protein [Nitrospiraceae bacterium]|nr:MAG: FtsX-like permease family protein [Nitrospiraceae bacterium]